MNERRPQEISESRKAMYYGGMAMSAVGFVVFLSLFVFLPNPQDGPDGFRDSMSRFAGRGVVGMVLIVAGQALQMAGRRGLAGSGVILDPEQARKDVEPWNRMAGGMVSDALEEVNLAKHLGQSAHSESPLVKVRCQRCDALNGEAAKFCDQCGAEM